MENEVILMIKNTGGDLVVGKLNELGDDQITLQDPLIVSVTSSYLLMTDYVPFISVFESEPMISFNLENVIYAEQTEGPFVDYYHLCVKYRDSTKVEIIDMLTRSEEMISKALSVRTAVAEATTVATPSDNTVTDAISEDLKKEATPATPANIIDMKQMFELLAKNKKDKLH